jgi:tetratricopeptide (TPR) repeat protein
MMSRIEKTVFISYRRTNVPWALAIFQDLTQHGFDVFFDYEGISSGDFEQVILQNIRSRAHFLVLLSPSALKHCDEPGDWLRLEIETALDCRRNIIPLFFEGFNFNTSAISDNLTGKLAALKLYNGLNIPAEYFQEAMERLRHRFLNVPLDSVLHPATAAARKAATRQKATARAARSVNEEMLTAQQWFERGQAAKDEQDQLRLYSEAIRVDPAFARAYYSRGMLREKLDPKAALQDYGKAIRLNPKDEGAFCVRGVLRIDIGDFGGAIEDLDAAIRLRPGFGYAIIHRGIARERNGDLDGALEDYDEAVRLFSPFPNLLSIHALLFRARARQRKGNLSEAVQDYDEIIRRQPDNGKAFLERGIARMKLGDRIGALEDCNTSERLGYKG